MVNLFIANTDNEWFDFLSSEQELAEVNFWQPGAKAFHAIQPGELFAFRLKSPRNKIGGFGVLSNSSVLPLQIAWEAFGRSNGTASYAALQAAISSYRQDDHVGPATNIGCRILVEPVFLPPHLWIELPSTWSKNIVGGKHFSTEEPEGLRVWEQLQEAGQLGVTPPTGFAEAGPRFGQPTLITPRLGQGAFRIAVTEAYGRQCALSEGKVLPALDAAHIRPYAEGGAHIKSNGILLRRDIHSVFRFRIRDNRLGLSLRCQQQGQRGLRQWRGVPPSSWKGSPFAEDLSGQAGSGIFAMAQRESISGVVLPCRAEHDTKPSMGMPRAALGVEA